MIVVIPNWRISRLHRVSMKEFGRVIAKGGFVLLAHELELAGLRLEAKSVS
jgi:hypothetical protein